MHAAVPYLHIGQIKSLSLIARLRLHRAAHNLKGVERQTGNAAVCHQLFTGIRQTVDEIASHKSHKSYHRLILETDFILFTCFQIHDIQFFRAVNITSILPCDSGTIRTDSKIFFRQPVGHIFFSGQLHPINCMIHQKIKGLIAAQVAQPSDILAQAPVIFAGRQIKPLCECIIPILIPVKRNARRSLMISPVHISIYKEIDIALLTYRKDLDAV